MNPRPRVRKVKLGGWTWRAREKFVPGLSALAEAVLSLPGNAGAERVKVTSGRRGIWKVRVAGAEVFVKHYTAPRFSKQVKHLVRNSRTRQEWEMGLKLEGLGLPVARPLAMAERRRSGLLQEDYLLEEWLEGYQNFDLWFREHWERARSGPELKQRREAVVRLAFLIRRLHDLGVLQRDFKPDSIMVGPDGDYKLVDLERALVKRRPGGLSLSDRLDNLTKIDQTFGFVGSLTDRLRFLRAYFGDRTPKKRLHAYALRIGESAERKFRKQARERRSWLRESNELYQVFEVRGFKVCAHRFLDRGFMLDFIKRMKRGDNWKLIPHPGPGHEGEKLSALWCDAGTALAHTPSLAYRKVPFVPARAAVFPASERFSLLLSLVPGPPLMTWARAAALARERGREDEFARELGRSLRVFHRMGITLREATHDAMLFDPACSDPSRRFRLNRLDLVELDRTPGRAEAMRFLMRTGDALRLSGRAQAALVEGYQASRLRWFRAPTRR